MGAMFRSDEIILTQMFMQPEASYEVLSELGEAGVVQFRDMNEGVNIFQRHFVAEVRRCDEMQRKLRYIESEMQKAKIVIPEIIPPRAPKTDEITALESDIDNTESDIRDVTQNDASLKKSFNELTELKYVLEKTVAFFEEAKGMDPFEPPAKSKSVPSSKHTPSSVQAVPTVETVRREREQLMFVAGVIRRQRIPAFERMLWRVSRGNVYVRLADLDRPIENPYTGIKRLMTAFVVFFQGKELQTRVHKICQGFHAKLYPCPESHAQRQLNLMAVNQQLRDLELVLKRTKEHRERVLREVTFDVPTWIIKVKKMKAIYHTLNLLNIDVTNKCFIGECWLPTADLPIVQKAMVDGSAAGGSQMPCFLNKIDTTEEPPTFNRTNRFTKGFQNLIDAYGISSYREANPGLYTIVTFPFLFAVMFGDIGHGVILSIFGIWMCWKEKKLIAQKSTNEIWNIFFDGRYIIMLMGFFSIYTGMVYNDLFSKSMNVFGSSWKIVDYTKATVIEEHNFPLECATAYSEKMPYPFGIDPVWQVAENKIIFLNSYKMKLSIIFGVLHMMFGVCMSVFNYNYFKERPFIILEFLPRLLFLVLLFAYMVFMMFFKWIRYSCQSSDNSYKESCAPSILITFIDMMMFKSVDRDGNCDPYMFPGQDLMQKVFVVVALCCIPIMLLGKPMHIWYQRRRKRETQKDLRKSHIQLSYNYTIGALMREPSAPNAKSKVGFQEAEEPFSEIMIHQAIHTIEYVLSTISHTASYLRLWALSLAHAQLSEVLWNMVLRQGLKTRSITGALKLYCFFALWAFGTISILVLMEGLSAFLHTLRLHWVEFMSKFFTGVGYAFKPFSFAAMIDWKSDDEDEKTVSV